jgi:septum formation protein
MILASGSPQRLALLRRAGVEPTVLPADVDETPLAGETPVGLVRRLARDKASAVAATHPHTVVLGADTIVEVDGRTLGKPSDDSEAVAMLARLSGGRVTVVSGVAVTGVDGATTTAHRATTLWFRDLSHDDVLAYVATGEPSGAAGGFRVQGRGGELLRAHHGCWTNVVGLPVCTTALLLATHGVTLTSDGCPAHDVPPG